MLIDGTVKRFPTAIVELDTPYLSGRVQALCMDDPVHDVIIGNVPGAKDPQLNCESSTPMTIVPDIETSFRRLKRSMVAVTLRFPQDAADVIACGVYFIRLQTMFVCT